MNGASEAGALQALVRVQLRPGVEPGGFEAHLRAGAAVAEAWRLVGDCDFEVRLSCRSLAGPGRCGDGAAGRRRHHLHHRRSAPVRLEA